MSPRTVLGLTALMLLAAAGTARADGPVPKVLRSLKPYQVVEQFMAQKEILNLTDDQFARLDELSMAIWSEKHRFTHQGGKPHTTQHVPMVTHQQAYDKAMAILTPDQRARFEALYPAPSPTERTARRPIVPHGKP